MRVTGLRYPETAARPLMRKFSLNPTVKSIGRSQRGLLAGLRRGWLRPGRYAADDKPYDFTKGRSLRGT